MPKIEIGSGHYEVDSWDDISTFVLEMPLENFEFEWNFKMSKLKAEKPELVKYYDWIGDRDEEGHFGNHKRTRYWAKRKHYRYVKG